MMSPSDINPSKPMSAYGMDSLVAVEIQNRIKRETGVVVSVFDVIQPLSIGKLVQQVAEGL
jgi:acyl carrier protein